MKIIISLGLLITLISSPALADELQGSEYKTETRSTQTLQPANPDLQSQSKLDQAANQQALQQTAGEVEVLNFDKSIGGQKASETTDNEYNPLLLIIIAVIMAGSAIYMWRASEPTPAKP